MPKCKNYAHIKEILHGKNSFLGMTYICTMRSTGIRILNQAFAILLLAGFFSCSTSEISPERIVSGKEFYPIEKGNFWIYKVDTIDYSFAGDTTRGSYFIKELIADSLYQQEGSTVYKIEIYRTADTTLAWAIDSVWSIRADGDKIIKTENNRPLVKLRFPLQEGSRWDGNQFNTQQDSNSVFWYTVRNLNKSAVFNDQNVASVEIVQKIDSNCINKSEFREVYYRGIGLGYKRRSFIQYSQVGEDPCGQIPKIEIGYTKTFTLISKGKD
jgi:hypothetical protein